MIAVEQATAKSGHTVTVEFEESGSWPTLTFTCHEPPGADCRMMCPHPDCEEGCYHAGEPGHERVPMDYCNDVEWLSNDDDVAGSIAGGRHATTTITAPIDVAWDRGEEGPDWRFATQAAGLLAGPDAAVRALRDRVDNVGRWVVPNGYAGGPAGDPTTAVMVRLDDLRAALEADAGVRSRGADLIATERRRQIEAEGYTPEHDAEHGDGSLALAAAVYAEKSARLREPKFPGEDVRFPRLACWPWRDEDFKPTDRLTCLVKAGALIAAEIDRLSDAGVQAPTSACGVCDFCTDPCHPDDHPCSDDTGPCRNHQDDDAGVQAPTSEGASREDAHAVCDA